MGRSERVFLRQDVIVEPLVDRWYAWPHLISPATAARTITERHLKIMASYMDAPKMHEMAARNPKMKGGPFMDYGVDRSAEVGALMKETASRRRASLRLSEALADLDALLRRQARGGPMAALYEQVPDALKGLVELTYGPGNEPGFRLIEPLLYRAHRAERSSQSLFLGRGNGIRPFMMSTPRLADDEEAMLHVPFDHPGVDMLFDMLLSSRPLEELGEALGMSDTMQARLLPFVTDASPVAPPSRASRWRYFGHACVLLETPECTILLDPAIRTSGEGGGPGFSYNDLPERIDYVLLTHNHQDHVLIETLLRLRSRIGTICVPRAGGGMLMDPSLRLALESMGFANVIELGEFEKVEGKGSTITATPFLGEHGDLAIQCKTTWHVRLGNRDFMFASDCKNLSPELFRAVRDAVGRVDVLFLGMECDGAPMSWIYGPLFAAPPAREHDQTRRLAGCDFREGAELVEIFGPEEIYVYAMGMEPWLNHIMATRYTAESNPIIASQALVDACRARGLQAERLEGAKEVAL